MSHDQDSHLGDGSTVDVEVGQRVAQLFRDEGVAERNFATSLAALLGISTKQARRKLRGEVGWRVDDILRIAAHLSRPPALLLGPLTEQEGAPPAVTVEPRGLEPLHRGTLTTRTPLRCTFRLGPSIDPARHQPGYLVAAQDPGGSWLITQAGDHRETTGELHSVSDITISHAPFQPRVAVLDDHMAAADAIAAWLRLQGYDADRYYESASLQSVLVQDPYDAYILDWRLTSEGTVLPLIEVIRAIDERVPILVLTGIATGATDPREERPLIAAVRDYDLTFLEKPAKLPMLQANLDAKLRQRATAHLAS